MGLMKPNFTAQYGIRPPIGERPYSDFSAVDTIATLTLSDLLSLSNVITSDSGSAAASSNIKVKRVYFTCYLDDGLGAGGQMIRLVVQLAGQTIYETYFTNVEGDKFEFEWDFEDTTIRRNDTLVVTVTSTSVAFGETANFRIAAGVVGVSF